MADSPASGAVSPASGAVSPASGAVSPASGAVSPVRFDKHMDAALYGHDGFYTRGGRPGLVDGDFTTSPERGTLFARCVALYLDSVWHQFGRPDPFVVVEGGAGVGTLCRAVLAAQPECLGALGYVMVERTLVHRRAALAALPDLPAAAANVPVTAANVPVTAANVPVTTLTDLPISLSPAGTPLAGVVMANELLDNLAVRVLQRGNDDDWLELHINPCPTSVARSAEVLLPASADAAAMADTLFPDAPARTRIPLQLQAAVWIRRAIQLLGNGPGRVLVFDYGTASTAELAERTMDGWLRTYAAHRRNPVAIRNATRDITCDVAFDQLSPGYTLTTQADWLAANGINQITAAARRRWQTTRLEKPTAATLADRALLDEAADLTNPAALGSFCVAEWCI